MIAIFGPTASGKTAVAEVLAGQIGGEIVSADSMQVYRGLPILTNQPSEPTRLVCVWPLEFEGSVGAYAHLAQQAIDEILAGGGTPVVVGGTGLYLRAALADLTVPPSAPAGVRERLERLYDRVGAIRAHELLAQRDPGAAARVHPNDRRRVVRALELVDLGQTLHPENTRLWSADTRHPTLIVGLELPMDLLERRIEARTRTMFDRGVEREVAAALDRELSRTARSVIGLHEVAQLSREQAIAAIVLRTRRYAAYQRKWMRRIPGIVRLDADRPAAEIADEITGLIRARRVR